MMTAGQPSAKSKRAKSRFTLWCSAPARTGGCADRTTSANGRAKLRKPSIAAGRLSPTPPCCYPQEFIGNYSLREDKIMRIPSHAFHYAAAAAILLVTLNAASAAHTRPYPRYHHSSRQHLYDYPGGYYRGAPQSCAPFTRNKMNDAIVSGDSKYLSCGH